MKKIKCIGCGGEFSDIKGPVHRYMESCAGCWAAFGEVLAREYSDPAYFEVHRLTVDAYAIQHPGSPTKRQCIHSVGVHLVRLCLFHEYGLSPENANDAMLEAAKNKHNFTWLEPPDSPGKITVADVVKKTTVQGHKAIVREWAKSAWDAWGQHHQIVRTWAQKQKQ